MDQSDDENGLGERKESIKRKFEGSFGGLTGRGKFSSAPRGRGQTQPRGNSFQQSRRIDSPAEKELHPSWAAKRSKKPTIARFEGKKTTFDNTDNQVGPKVSVSENKKRVVDSSLHPSWVAKQNSNPSIKAFQGKKTVFED